jgi:hypothetical protein
VKKFTLETEPPDDFLLLGIASQEKSHRMAWLLNQHISLQLQKEDDVILFKEDLPAAYFNRFDYTDELNRTTYTLLDNSYENIHLLPELKNISFLIMINGALEFFDVDSLVKKIKKINGIQLVSNVNIKKLKSINQLILPESKSQKLLL